MARLGRRQTRTAIVLRAPAQPVVVTPEAGVGTACLASTGVAAKVTVELGSNVLGAFTTGSAVKVAVVNGVCATSFGGVGTETTTLTPTRPLSVLVVSQPRSKVWANQGGQFITATPTVLTTTQASGVTSIGAVGTALPRKVAAAVGLCAAAPFSVGGAAKVAVVQGTSHTGLAATQSGQQTRAQNGVCGGSLSALGTPRKTLVGSGTAAAGVALAGTASKLTAARGVAVVGFLGRYSAVSTRAVNGTCAITLVVTGTHRKLTLATATLGTCVGATGQGRKRVSALGIVIAGCSGYSQPKRLTTVIGHTFDASALVGSGAKRTQLTGVSFALLGGYGTVQPQFSRGVMTPISRVASTMLIPESV